MFAFGNRWKNRESGEVGKAAISLVFPKFAFWPAGLFQEHSKHHGPLISAGFSQFSSFSIARDGPQMSRIEGRTNPHSDCILGRNCLAEVTQTFTEGLQSLHASQDCRARFEGRTSWENPKVEAYPPVNEYSSANPWFFPVRTWSTTAGCQEVVYISKMEGSTDSLLVEICSRC